MHFYYGAKGTNLEMKTQPKTTFRLSPVRYRAPRDDHMSYTIERTVKTFFLSLSELTLSKNQHQEMDNLMVELAFNTSDH